MEKGWWWKVVDKCTRIRIGGKCEAEGIGKKNAHRAGHVKHAHVLPMGSRLGKKWACLSAAVRRCPCQCSTEAQGTRVLLSAAVALGRDAH